MEAAVNMASVAGIEEAIELKARLEPGHLIYDRSNKMCYCMSNISKLSIVVEEELTPCIGSECPKKNFCYKYYLAKKFPEEHFILRDLSVSTETVYDEFDNNLGTHICCSKDSRYKCFRWED